MKAQTLRGPDPSPTLGGPDNSGALRRTAQNFALFFLSRHNFCSFSRRRIPNVHFSGPGRSGKKKREILAAHPSGPHIQSRRISVVWHDLIYNGLVIFRNHTAPLILGNSSNRLQHGRSSQGCPHMFSLLTHSKSCPPGSSPLADKQGLQRDLV